MPLKRSRRQIDPNALGSLVIVSLTSTLDLDTTDQEFVNDELEWLFSAADHLIKINSNEVDASLPVSEPVPPEAKVRPEANNKLLSGLDDFDLQIWKGQIESGLKRINIHLRNLNILLEQETIKGLAGKGDVYLQNQIRSARLDIVNILQEMTELMNQAYGIRITSPDQLIEILEE